jgi:hypothetical protein
MKDRQHENLRRPQGSPHREGSRARAAHAFLPVGAGRARDAVDARIRAKIAGGEANPHDRFVTFAWTRPEGEGAEH